jgi:hypothetical protein
MRDGPAYSRDQIIRLLAERLDHFNERFDELLAEQMASTPTGFTQTIRVNGQLVTTEEPEGLEEYVELRIRETRKLTVQALLDTIFRSDGRSPR